MLRLILLTFLIVLCLPPAAGATAVSGETANLYYQNCMTPDDNRMTDDAQEGLCSCAAARLPLIMTVQELNTLNPDPSHPGRPAYDKMLTHVYAPCLQYPVEDQLMNECLNDSAIQAFALRDPGALCYCMAKKTGHFLADESEDIIQAILRRSPGLTDPYDTILNDGTFRQHAYDNLSSCLPAGN